MANHPEIDENSQLSVRIPADLKRRAKAQAALSGLTWDAAIRQALEAWLPPHAAVTPAKTPVTPTPVTLAPVAALTALHTTPPVPVPTDTDDSDIIDEILAGQVSK